MQYNFESLANELIEKFDKKLESNSKAVFKQVSIIFDVLCEGFPRDKRQELEQTIKDILSDGVKSQSVVFSQIMLKMTRMINEVL